MSALLFVLARVIFDAHLPANLFLYVVTLTLFIIASLALGTILGDAVTAALFTVYYAVRDYVPCGDAAKAVTDARRAVPCDMGLCKFK